MRTADIRDARWLSRLRHALARYRRSDDWARRRRHVLFAGPMLLVLLGTVAYLRARDAVLAAAGAPDATRLANAIAGGLAVFVVLRWLRRPPASVARALAAAAAGGGAYWLISVALDALAA